MKLEKLREVASKLQSFNADGTTRAGSMDIKITGDLLFISADKIENLQGRIAALEAENAKLRVIVEAVKKLRVITPEEMEHGKPFWIVPCGSYETLKKAMDEWEMRECSKNGYSVKLINR